MNQKLIIGIVVVIVLGGLWWFFYSTDSSKTENSAASTQSEAPEATSSAETSSDIVEESEEESAGNIITYTNSGYGPQSLTVKTGETITWKNDSSSTIQIGSANHPTHTINRDITGNNFVIELAPGESAQVQLTRTGEWGYHDHLRPSMTGTITVSKYEGRTAHQTSKNGQYYPPRHYKDVSDGG